MTSCDQLSTLLTEFSLVERCDVVRDGTLRLATPFLYQDGSQIDLFLSEPPQEDLTNVVLSDKGNTSAYLLDLNIKHWSTKRRKLAVQDICDALEVAMNGGQLEIHLSPIELTRGLPSAILRLAQACIRVSDLALTQRLRTVNSFKEDVEEFFESRALAYETPVLLPGRFGNNVEVDFRVVGRSRPSLIQTVSTENAAAAHSILNEVFRRWYDIEERKGDQQFLTIYDSGSDAFRDEDLRRVGDKSVLLAYPAEADRIAEALAA